MSADASDRLCTVVQALERSGRFEPVSNDASEVLLWQDHDLANVVENRLGKLLDPRSIDAVQRRELTDRAAGDGEGFGIAHPYFKSYWIVDSAERVGTLSIATSLLGSSLLGLSSLYVVPESRGRGHAERALRAAHAAALAAELSGVRLSTDWSWQRAVRFYLKLGFWVRGWKRSLDFVWRRNLPGWRMEVDADRARFFVQENDTWQMLIAVNRTGQRLSWNESTAHESEVEFLAPGTFAVALAVRGFPLITSDDAWRAQLALGFSDIGGPEGLAFKIRRFEAWDRKHGWQTPAPRIPGLDYPEWDAVD